MRLAPFLVAMLLAAGCQVQNPLAAFSPRIRPPTTSQTPYYPPTSAAPQRTGSATPTSPRLNVSAESSPTPLPARSFVAETTDREPIRVVENPSATRTASSTNRTSSPAANSSVPAAPSSNGTPRSLPGVTPQSRNLPGPIRRDTGVIPASYEQNSPAFTETAPTPGQWRAR